MSTYLAHLRAFSRDARLFLLAYAVLSVGTAAPQVLAPLYFRSLGFDAGLIESVSTDDLSRPAPRPDSSKMSCLFSERFGLSPMADWKDALRRFLSAEA